jgi:hypothetical protein
MSRILLFVCLVVFMVVPVSHLRLQAQTSQPGIQGNQEHPPYYDPRYTPGNEIHKNQPNTRSEAASEVSQDQALTPKQNPVSELPKTAGNGPMLCVIGILSLVGSAGLRLATSSSFVRK